jgi:hypothetical protein
MISPGKVSRASSGSDRTRGEATFARWHPNEPEFAAPKQTRRARSYGDHRSAGPAAAAGAPRTE